MLHLDCFIMTMYRDHCANVRNKVNHLISSPIAMVHSLVKVTNSSVTVVNRPVNITATKLFINDATNSIRTVLVPFRLSTCVPVGVLIRPIFPVLIFKKKFGFEQGYRFSMSVMQVCYFREIYWFYCTDMQFKYV